MREQRGRHFDPVLLDTFLEVLSSSGPDAREQLRSDPQALLEVVLETYLAALERGDAETAEGAIAQAIEDGVAATALPEEVILPALRRMAKLREQGEIDAERERAAIVIARRVLATLRRYMLGRQEEPRALEQIDETIEVVERLLERAAPPTEPTPATLGWRSWPKAARRVAQPGPSSSVSRAPLLQIDFHACPIARSSPAEPASSAPTSWTPCWPTATR